LPLGLIIGGFVGWQTARFARVVAIEWLDLDPGGYWRWAGMMAATGFAVIANMIAVILLLGVLY
jgi:hypothetical protein